VGKWGNKAHRLIRAVTGRRFVFRPCRANWKHSGEEEQVKIQPFSPHSPAPRSPSGLHAVRPEWTGWQLPSFANDDEAETEVEELPAIGENEPLLLPEDQDDREWLLPEEDALSSAASQPEQKEGLLTFWSLVGIMYFASSGGPEGTEGLVAAAGPGGAMIGIFLAACVWSAPIALMSAELGTMVPENGGPMVWARAAFGAGTLWGDGVAFLVGWCSFLFTAVDAALYPSMFVSYFVSGTDLLLSPAQVMGIKIVFCCALILHNCAGVDAVGEGSKAMIVLLLCPFIAFIVVAFTGLGGWPFDASPWAQIPAEPKYGDAVLLLAWNLGTSVAALHDTCARARVRLESRHIICMHVNQRPCPP